MQGHPVLSTHRAQEMKTRRRLPGEKPQLDPSVLLGLFFQQDRMGIRAFELRSSCTLPCPFGCIFTNRHMEKTDLVSQKRLRSRNYGKVGQEHPCTPPAPSLPWSSLGDGAGSSRVCVSDAQRSRLVTIPGELEKNRECWLSP